MNNRIKIYLLLILFLLLAAVCTVFVYFKKLYEPAPQPVLIPYSPDSTMSVDDVIRSGGTTVTTADTSADKGAISSMYDNISFPIQRELLDDSVISSYFTVSKISSAVFARMRGVSYPDGCKVPVSDLRYIKVLHFGFDGLVHKGELVVNVSISDDIVDIFRQLFDASYPIESVRLIDDFDADDEASMSANNSSAFNYRYVVNTLELSNHSYGLAIDINPLYNPYITYNKDGSMNVYPENGMQYVDRTAKNPYRIDDHDLCYKLFMEHGFFWGGDWPDSPDYQHFYKEPLFNY